MRIHVQIPLRWSDFDADEVRQEFALIRDLGMSVVRIFLLWDDWQPTADTVSPTCLRDERCRAQPIGTTPCRRRRTSGFLRFSRHPWTSVDCHLRDR